MAGESMRWRKRARVVAVVFVLAASVAGCELWDLAKYTWRPVEPERTGEFAIEGVREPISIVFDRFDIPHIDARNDADLFFAIGYLHGRERLFQMTTLRALASGRLCELFGNQKIVEGPETDSVFPDLLTTDKWFRIAGLRRHAERAATQLSGDDLAAANAYVAGVNAAAAREPLPIEFTLLGVSPEPWTLADVWTVARLQAWALQTNMAQELMRLLMAAELGEDIARETYPLHDSPGPHIIERSDRDYREESKTWAAAPAAKATTQPSASIASAYRDAALAAARIETGVRFAWGMALPAASNSWTLGPSRTKSGGALAANDPHLQHTAPATFYLVHQHTGDLDAIGATIPGVPFIVLGRNRDVAWTATTTFADMQDLYLEKIDPANAGNYITPTGPAPFEIEQQTIRVKRESGDGFDEIPLAIRHTRHGPVISDAAANLPRDAEHAIALRSTMDDAGAMGDVLAMKSLARARNVAEFRAAYTHIEVPVQNWMAADRHGAISYFPAGRVPIRDGWDGTTPVPGWTDEYEWRGWIPVDRLPQIENPASGRIVTANNKVVPIDDYPWPFSNDPMPAYRAARIVEMIDAAPKHDVADVARMQVDTYVKQGERLRPSLVAALMNDQWNAREAAALAKLRDWNLRADANEIGAAVFFATYRQAWRMTLADDLSPAVFDLVTQALYAYGFFDRLWDEIPNARVFDVKSTPQKETRDDILRAAFRAAVAELGEAFGDDVNAWTWGRMNQLTFEHPMGSAAPLTSLVNVGPRPIPGALDAVFAEAGLFLGKGKIKVNYGPVFRMVHDFGDPDAGGMVLDLGQSGRPGTSTYANGVEPWSRGELWPVSMDSAKYNDGALGTLTMGPR